MADSALEVGQLINVSEFTRSFWSTLPQQFFGNVTFLFTLAKTIGIIFLIYLVFLIIKSIVNIRQALRTKSIEANVIEINKKLDLIVGKHHHKDDKSEKEDKKK